MASTRLARRRCGHAARLLCAAAVALHGCDDGNRQIDGTITSDGGGPRPVPTDGAQPLPDVDPNVCDEVRVNLGRVIPDLLIVLDRSNSMSGDALWDPVREALYAVTHALDDKISFGLMVFPQSEGEDACTGHSNGCEPGTEAIVPCALGNAPDIRNALVDLHTCGATPTAETLLAARSSFTLDIDPRLFPPTHEVPSYVLVATDGAPNCSVDADGTTCRCTTIAGGCEDYPPACLDDEATYAAIDGLRGLGVRVFVLGIRASEWRDVLDQMAARGGTGAAFMADDHEAIRTGLEEIVGRVTTCEFAVEEPSALADPGLVNFYLDGNRVPMDRDPECDFGWRWVVGRSQRRVLFCGPHCEAILNGEVGEVRATFGCPTLY